MEHYKPYKIDYLYHTKDLTGISHPGTPDSQAGSLFTSMSVELPDFSGLNSSQVTEQADLA